MITLYFAEASTPTYTKKKRRLPDTWKQNIRKKLRQAGQEYLSQRGKVMKAKHVKPPCVNSCFYMCTQHFSDSDRNEIFSKFWNLSDEEKNSFYCQFVKKKNVERKRIKGSERKKNTFQYSLYSSDDIIHSVCRIFFLNTLCINEKRIYYYFKHLHNEKFGVPRSLRKGKNTKHFIEPERVEEVKNHINSFPTIDSHYCRASSGRKYLSSNLSLLKMYSLYLQTNPSSPVSEKFYRNLFNYNFNLSFTQERSV